MARRGGAACILLAAVGVAALVVRPATAQETAKITVTVYNRSTMDAPVLAAGQSVAQKILRGAGVESMWVDCPVQGTPEANPECRQQFDHPKIILTIVPRWAGPVPGSDQLGLAAEVENGIGSYCYVFQERLEQLAAAKHVSAARLLGHAIAHEIGHLLKGSNSHSSAGLMSKYWYANELRAVAMGSLIFTTDDTEKIRARLAAAKNEE
jgi:hypothetical protein